VRRRHPGHLRGRERRRLVDIFFGGAYQTGIRLLLGDGKGGFENVSATHLPKHALSLGDAEFGDADLDGDLDLALADWGPGNPMENEGGAVLMWLNDGAGKFAPASGAVQDKKIRFSWDIEFADIDNDFDVDLMVSSKMSEGGSLYINDGIPEIQVEGTFPDGTKLLTIHTRFDSSNLRGERFFHAPNSYLGVC
jgi:hypothetical protein